jgi:hypothetical protein
MTAGLEPTEELLRRTLRERATDVDGPAAARVPRDHRNRYGRWRIIAGIAAAVLLVVGGIWVGVRRSPSNQTNVSTRPASTPPSQSTRTAPETTTTTDRSEGAGSATVPTIGVEGIRFVYGDRAYDGTQPVGPSIDLGGIVSPDFSPVATPYGIVALVGPKYDHHELRVRPTDGGMTRLLTSDAAGFAVDSAGQRVAWATALPSGTTSVLREVDLETGAVIATTTIDQFGRVGGFIDDRVVVTVGDGLARVRLWSPARGVVEDIRNNASTWGHVLGTDPARHRAVLTQDDGLCAQVVEFGGRDTSLKVIKDLPGCQTRGPARFTSDGRWLAVTAGSFEAPVLTIFDLTGRVEPFETTVPVVDFAWTMHGPGSVPGEDGPPQLLVVPADSKPVLRACRPDLRSCTALDRLSIPPPSALIAKP